MDPAKAAKLRQKAEELFDKEEFDKALNLIRNERPGVEEHVRGFLRNAGVVDDDIVHSAVDKAEKLLKDLSVVVELDGEKKRFISWIFLGSRNHSILRSLQRHAEIKYQRLSRWATASGEAERKIEEALTNLEKVMNTSGEAYREMTTGLKELNQVIR